MKLISRNQQTTNKWAGGTTTQLAIYPEDGSYGDRDFNWRLSTAVVELEESVFTSLPGFDRVIMVLEGEMELVHEGHHNIKLKRFEQDSFKGEWNTTSYGKARDFNLMLKEGIEGRLEHYTISPNEKLLVNSEERDGKILQHAFYTYEGKVRLEIDKEEMILEEGDLFVFQCQGFNSPTLQALDNLRAEVVIAYILI